MSQTLLILTVVVLFGDGFCYSIDRAQLVDEICPVMYDGECFKVMGRKGSAFTRLSGDQLCHDVETFDIGYHGHLANVYNKEHFDLLAEHIIDDVEYSNSDPDVLLGMTYDPDADESYSYDGDLIPDAYWGSRPHPLSWGINLVMRVSRYRAESTRLQNIGDEKLRYERIMCQFRRK